MLWTGESFVAKFAQLLIYEIIQVCMLIYIFVNTWTIWKHQSYNRYVVLLLLRGHTIKTKSRSVEAFLLYFPSVSQVFVYISWIVLNAWHPVEDGKHWRWCKISRTSFFCMTSSGHCRVIITIIRTNISTIVKINCLTGTGTGRADIFKSLEALIITIFRWRYCKTCFLSLIARETVIILESVL